MRVWDIADQVYPGIQITETHSRNARFTGIVSSAMKVALAVSFVVATSSTFTLAREFSTSETKAKISVWTTREPGGQISSPQVRRRVSMLTDTQFGQSTVKLSRAFAAYFEQAPDEERYEDDYSF